MKRHNEQYVLSILKGVLETSVKTDSAQKNEFRPIALSGTEILEICKYINKLSTESEASDHVL